MYNASEAFHKAVKSNAHQIAMLIFEDAVFTNTDIDVDSGIEFHDVFNLKEDLSIGQTPSNEISFSIFNDDGILNDYEFGEFTALCGALIATDRFVKSGNVTVNTQYGTYVGNSRYPFITRNGIPLPSQTSFAIHCILAYDGHVYVFNKDGRHAVYNDASGASETGSVKVAPFMAYKTARLEGIGAFYNKTSRILFVYKDGYRKRYEFVPYGKFSAVRPDVPTQVHIDFNCNDYMQKFEIEMPSKEDMGITYPITVGALLEACCRYVKVENGETGNFINKGLEIEKEPSVFSKCTMREVIGWIAEAAGSNARFDRDGKLRLMWLKESNVRMDEHDYEEFQPYWYLTAGVDRVLNRDTENAADDVNGYGRNGYLIQDNPFLRVKSKDPEGDQPWDKAQEWFEEMKNEKIDG